jgi:transposase
MSNKQENLQLKIKRLLTWIGCPRFLHRFGPKKYTSVAHVAVLLVKEAFKLSFRRVSLALRSLGLQAPSYSALCKSRKRIPLSIWHKLLQMTAGMSSGKGAIDSTGISRTNPSFHFIKRIDRKKPVKSYVKLSALIDLRTKKFHALRMRMKLRHDICDVRGLLSSAARLDQLYADTAYDAEWLHEYCWTRGTQTIIKPRVNVRKGFYRRKQLKGFTKELYGQRALVESGFSSLKRKYGSHTLAKGAKAIKVEMYCRAIGHNINLRS